MLKYTVKISPEGKDLNINLPLVNKTELSGQDNDIARLISDETDDSINEVQDGEKIRYTPLQSRTATFSFKSGSTYVNKISPTEFNSSSLGTEMIRNSFYLCQIYDSPNQDNQLLLHTSYINGYTFGNSLNSIYNWTSIYEYTDIHLSKVFLDTITATTFNLYFKFSFYSGKSGTIFPFYNLSSVSVAEDKLYYISNFSKTTKKYTLATNFSLREISNADYVNLINESVASTNIEKPVVPAGNTFTTNGEYIIQ